MNDQNHKYGRIVCKIYKLTAYIFVTAFFFAFSCTQPNLDKIGVLNTVGDILSPVSKSFIEKMTELGYEEGKNITYDIQIENDKQKASNKLQKFVDDKVKLILVYPDVSIIQEAKNITKGTSIPVVFTFTPIEGTNIIKSISEPGDNISGVRYPVVDTALKRLEILMKIVPNAKRIAIPHINNYEVIKSQMEAINAQAAALGLTIIEVPANNPAELEPKLQAEVGKGLDALLFLVEPLTVTPPNFMIIAKIAYKNKLPFGGTYLKFGDLASLFGVAVERSTAGKDAAILTDKIIRGATVDTLPVMSSENFFQINIVVAQKLGLTIPPDILNQADKVEK